MKGTTAITRVELDVWLGDADMFILHGHCHPGSGQLVFYMGGMIGIRCRTCNLHVINIAIAQAEHEKITGSQEVAAVDLRRLKPSCHPKNGLRMSYHDDGTVKARCGRCRAAITEMEVLKAP